VYPHCAFPTVRQTVAVRPKANGGDGQRSADSVEKVDFSGTVTVSLASSKNLFTTVKWLFGPSLTVAALSLDLHEKEFAIPVTVRHPLDDLYSIVYSFQLTGASASEPGSRCRENTAGVCD